MDYVVGLVVIILIIIGAYLSFRHLNKPMRHQNLGFDSLKETSWALINQYDHGSAILIGHQSCEYYLMFVRNLDKNDGVDFYFPKADWSSNEFEKLQRGLSEYNLDFAEGEPPEIDEFIYIKLSSDFIELCHFLKKVLTTLGLPNDNKYELAWQNPTALRITFDGKKYMKDIGKVSDIKIT